MVAKNSQAGLSSHSNPPALFLACQTIGELSSEKYEGD
jgi:hypothetical protein